MARTSGFQSGNRGSIPLGSTDKEIRNGFGSYHFPISIDFLSEEVLALLRKNHKNRQA